MALTARTNVETFLFAVKGKPEHTMEGFIAALEKASRYLLHGMKKHTSDIVKEFESYVLNNVEGISAVNLILTSLIAQRSHIKPQRPLG
jgi:hypothetical protein